MYLNTKYNSTMAAGTDEMEQAFGQGAVLNSYNCKTNAQINYSFQVHFVGIIELSYSLSAVVCYFRRSINVLPEYGNCC